MKKDYNENTDSWEQTLRGKLESHVSEPPADLWEAISHDVEKEERRIVALHTRRWTTVAAMMAMIALVGELAWQRYSATNGGTEQGAASVRVAKNGSASSVQLSGTSHYPDTEHILAGVTGRIPVKRYGLHMGNSVADHITTVTVCDDTTESNATRTESEGAHKEDSSEIVKKTEQSYTPHQMLLADNTIPMNTNMGNPYNKYRTLNVSLSASGLPNEGSSGHSVSVISSDSGTGIFIGPEGGLKEGSLQQDVYEHDYPLKVGLSLAWQFSEHLTAESGINYTYLHSTITTLGSGQSGSSSVNYLGIPLSLSYRVWHNDRISVYSGIGGEAAKSLQGKQWQFSTMLSMGVQYDLSHICGIYLQPSIDYYFHNHSDIQTYYTEHPLMPSLQIGLRFNIK